MDWIITSTSDHRHIGIRLPLIEVGQVITFADGFVIQITQVFTADEGRTMLACGVNYQITLIKE